jgi:hypothetical protein
MFIARSLNATSTIEGASPTMLKEHIVFHDRLVKLAEIIRRDTGIQPSTANLSTSAIEFGLSAFLGAEVHEGTSLVLEASKIADAITRGEFSEMILLTPTLGAFENESLFSLFELVRSHVNHRAIIVTSGNGTHQPTATGKQYFLRDVPLFQAPVHDGSSIDEKRRDLIMRLEKIIPTILEDMRKKKPAIEKQSKGTRA